MGVDDRGDAPLRTVSGCRATTTASEAIARSPDEKPAGRPEGPAVHHTREVVGKHGERHLGRYLR